MNRELMRSGKERRRKPERRTLFLPLGGSSEIGMNFNLYGSAHDRKWIVVDLGITFADRPRRASRSILPDRRFIEERRDDLSGIVLTHAHEDHIGAVALAVAAAARRRSSARLHRLRAAREAARKPTSLDGRDDRIVAPGGTSSRAVQLELIACHPLDPRAATALAIRTPLGNILHTGDWKLDPEPLLGGRTDSRRASRHSATRACWRMVCDCTNVFVDGHLGLRGRGARQPDPADRPPAGAGGVDLLRLQHRAAGQRHARPREATGRERLRRRPLDAPHVGGGAGGRAMLDDMPRSIDEREADSLPRHKVLYLCTGSQGEPRAALPRIADGQHPRVRLERWRHGDLLVEDHPRQRARPVQSAEHAGRTRVSR